MASLILRAEGARRLIVLRTRLRFRLRDTVPALDEREELPAVEIARILEVVARTLGERLVALGDRVEEVAHGDDLAQLERLAPVDQDLEHHPQRGPLPLQE